MIFCDFIGIYIIFNKIFATITTKSDVKQSASNHIIELYEGYLREAYLFQLSFWHDISALGQFLILLDAEDARLWQVCTELDPSLNSVIWLACMAGVALRHSE